MMYASMWNIESKVLRECRCSEMINVHGLGNCLPNSNPKFCYLMDNTTCQDSTKSELYSKKRYSKIACELRINIKSKSNESAAKNINGPIYYVLFNLLVASCLN